VQDSDVVAMED